MSRAEDSAAFLLAAASLLIASPARAVAEKPERISLWPGKAPVDAATTESANAFITVYRPERPNGTAFVICPGGGYGTLVKRPEGTGIATWLNRHGIAGIVLEYRLPRGKPLRSLSDAQRAIRTARARAREWGLDRGRIGIIGFSAGGHLASTAATHFDAGTPGSVDPVERFSCRPDFAILVYPVVTMGPGTHGGSRRNFLGKQPSAELQREYSAESQVTSRTPPMFLAHAADDRVVLPPNSKNLYEALRAQKIPAKYLELPRGGHGLNRYKGPMWDAWQKQSLEWLDGLRVPRGGDTE
jgi:acetyl esterase/lipase